MSADDERARERAAILQRRAKLVAYAVAAGVATAACSGRTTCLVPASLGGSSGSGGKPVTTGGGGVCLSIGGSPSTAGGPITPCLSPIAGTSFGGNTICLQPPLEGGAPNPGAAGAGGEPAEGGATSEAGATGEGGAPGPVICLTPVP